VSSANIKTQTIMTFCNSVTVYIHPVRVDICHLTLVLCAVMLTLGIKLITIIKANKIK